MNKMYVITRDDLGTVYKMVQGAHALAQFMLEHGQVAKEWNNQTIVFLSVDDEQKLTKLASKLDRSFQKFSYFREPDIGNQLTALASYGDGKIFGNIRLASES